MMMGEQKPADWDSKNILLNAKVYNVRCTQGKNPNLKSVSNMGYLLKVIQEKNSRNKNLLLMSLQKRNEAFFSKHDPSTISKPLPEQQNIYNIPVLPFEPKNQLAHLQRHMHINKNSLLIYRANQKLRVQAQKERQIRYRYLRSKSQMKLAALPKAAKKSDKPKTSDPSDKEEDIKLLKPPVNSFTKSKRASTQMDRSIVNWIEQLWSKEKLDKELELISSQIDLHNSARVFAIFYKLLNQKIEQANSQNLTVFEYLNRLKINDYYDIHLRPTHKLQSEIQFRTLYARNAKPYQDSDVEKLEKFFCKCFFLFLGGQKTKSQLIQILKQTPHSHFIHEIQSFFKGQEPQQNQQKIDTALYVSITFYKMFVKLIYPSEFTTEENALFRGNEKNIFWYLQHKYRNQFSKTMLYKIEKDRMFDELAKMMKNKDKQGIERVLMSMIQMGDFDNIYFKLFSSFDSRISPLQNVFLLEIFVFNKGLLLNSIHTQANWAAQMINQLCLLASTTTNEKSQWKCKFIFKLLKKCQSFFESEKIAKIAQKIVHENFLLINCPENAQIIEQRLHIPWEDMENTLLRSLGSLENAEQVFQAHMQIYVSFDNPIPKFIGTETMTRISIIIKNNSENNRIQDLKLTETVKKMLKQSPDEKKYKDRFFLLGLRMLIKSYVNFYLNEQKPSEEQAKQMIYKLTNTLEKAEKLIRKVHEINGFTNLNSESKSQLPPEILEREAELECFIERVEEATELGRFFIYLHQFQKGFVEENLVIMERISLGFQNFIGRKGNFKNFIARICLNMNWLFVQDGYPGLRTYIQRLTSIHSTVESLCDTSSRKINPDRMAMMQTYDFLESFMSVCISMTKQVKISINKKPIS